MADWNSWQKQQTESLNMAADGQFLVVLPVNLLEDLIGVCDWRASLSTCYRAGETYETCPDQNAVDYLDSEAEAIKNHACIYLRCPDQCRPH